MPFWNTLRSLHLSSAAIAFAPFRSIHSIEKASETQWRSSMWSPSGDRLHSTHPAEQFKPCPLPQSR
ncbi:hypothetical protein H6F67_05385 [Microcoleus sp. FACHB-1515]|uniref:hypothetical protein n=1 Tax=Cyanophyceae TaxID=3028117 RepID=UPI001683566E|nr:hypothetical protein [Microcoleus sp. FACHB-1515]MBD2089283.1 hypothetical protein [Microcoleus sp. FACHB-1515]